MTGLAEDQPRDGAPKPRRPFTDERNWPRQLWETIRRAFVEFLMVPTLVIGCFLLLALVMYVIDASRSPYGAAPAAKWGGLFSDPQASRGFLGVIATSIITVTSITLSLLLIAVQQGAASLTSLVFDQFLRRRTNQLYFGFFIGLALYSLIVLASINASHQPVYGLAVAGVMTAIALFMLILLIYTTINQMRPVVIIRSIHDHTLLARERQRELLRITRRRPRYPNAVCASVASNRSGFAAWIDVAAITKALPDAETEVVILVSVGDYVAFGDCVAEIRMSRQRDVPELEPAIRKAVALEEQRNLDTDPTFGIEQLVTIGWTSISTAKSNPDPGLLTIYSLRDLLARWVEADEAFGSVADAGADPTARVIYPDNLSGQIMKGFESLAVVASEIDAASERRGDISDVCWSIRPASAIPAAAGRRPAFAFAVRAWRSHPDKRPRSIAVGRDRRTDRGRANSVCRCDRSRAAPARAEHRQTQFTVNPNGSRQRTPVVERLRRYGNGGAFFKKGHLRRPPG